VSGTDLDFDLGGRRALVTGAGAGVGAGIADQLASAGVHVVVNDIDPDRAGAVADRIVGAGGTSSTAVFDVTDHDAVRAAVAATGPIDVLVNNAGNAGVEGFGRLVDFVDTTPADWNAFMSVNVHGVLNCTHAVLPSMIERGWGRVITIISDSARSGGSRMAVYGAAKAAAAGLTRGIAGEVGRHGITVNNIALGTIRTEATESLWSGTDNAELQRQILSGYPIRRPGEPADVAWVTAMLASPRASWITGQTIPVNGGFSQAL